MKENQVSIARVSVLAVTQLGVLCGSSCVSGWVEILNLLNALKYTGKAKSF